MGVGSGVEMALAGEGTASHSVRDTRPGTRLSFLCLSGQAFAGQPEPRAGGLPPPARAPGPPRSTEATRCNFHMAYPHTRWTDVPSRGGGDAILFSFGGEGPQVLGWWWVLCVGCTPTPRQRPHDVGAAGSGHGRREHLAMFPLQSHLRGRRTAACCTWSRSLRPGQGGFQPPELRTGPLWVPEGGGSEGRHSGAELSHGAD